MTTTELLKRCAAAGMTARQAAEASGASLAYAYSLSSKGVVRFAKEKTGPKIGTTWAWRKRAYNLDRAAQIVAEVDALPPAKLPLYRALRLEAGFKHARAMELVA